MRFRSAAGFSSNRTTLLNYSYETVFEGISRARLSSTQRAGGHLSSYSTFGYSEIACVLCRRGLQLRTQ